MSLRPGMEDAASDACTSLRANQPPHVGGWLAGGDAERLDLPPRAAARTQGRPTAAEAERLRRIIEGAIGDIFGVPQEDLSKRSRGKAPVALARQVAMYIAHVACRLSLTDVGLIFARDRTTVAHACAVVEDKRDDPVFDRALELMEWIVPAMVGHGSLSDHRWF